MELIISIFERRPAVGKLIQHLKHNLKVLASYGYVSNMDDMQNVHMQKACRNSVAFIRALVSELLVCGVSCLWKNIKAHY